MSRFSVSEFVPVAPRVWRAVAEPAAVTIGLVAGDSEALIIDTGSSPEQGAELRRAAERVAGVAVRAVVVTHWHYDHLFGLAAFADLDSYAHESVAGWLSRPECADAARELGVDPAGLAAPTRPFSLAVTRDLGGRRVEAVHFGRGHTDGDVVLIVPDADVVFAGDLIESAGPPAIGEDCHLREWPSAVDGVLGLLGEHTVVVPGHGDPVDRIPAFQQRAALAGLYSQAERLIGRGVRLEQACDAGEWPFDEATVRAALPVVYAQLARQGKQPGRTLPLV